MTFGAETRTVVNDAVADCSRNTFGPVCGLSEACRTFGTEIGTRNVCIAIRNALHAFVVHEDGVIGAGKAYGHRGVGAVIQAAGNVSHDNALFSMA